MNSLHKTKTLFQFMQAKLPLWTVMAVMVNVTAVDKRKASLFLLFSIIIESRITLVKVTTRDLTSQGQVQHWCVQAL